MIKRLEVIIEKINDLNQLLNLLNIESCHIFRKGENMKPEKNLFKNTEALITVLMMIMSLMTGIVITAIFILWSCKIIWM